MGGQPFSSFKGAHPQFGLDAFDARPELAPLVMRVISLWAMIDWTNFLMVNDCLKGDRVVASSMFKAIESQSAQRAAIQAGARAILPEPDWGLFEESLRAIAPARNVRNQFVHNLWGFSEQLPGALLLNDMYEAGLEHSRRVTRFETRLKDGVPIWEAGETEFHAHGVTVWRERDLRAEVKSAERASHITSQMWHLISNHQSGRNNESTRALLRADPLIKQRVERREQRG